MFAIFLGEGGIGKCVRIAALKSVAAFNSRVFLEESSMGLGSAWI